MARGGKAIKASVQQRLFERLLRAPLAFLDRLPAGAAAGFLRDIAELEDGLLHIPVEVARSVGTLVPAALAVWRRRTIPLFFVVTLMGPGLAAVSSLAAIRSTAIERNIRALEAGRTVRWDLALTSNDFVVEYDELFAAFLVFAHPITRFVRFKTGGR